LYFCLPSSEDTYRRRSHCPTFDINCEKTSTHHSTTRACPAYFHIFDLHKQAGLMCVCLHSPSATRHNFEFSADIALVFIKETYICVLPFRNSYRPKLSHGLYRPYIKFCHIIGASAIKRLLISQKYALHCWIRMEKINWSDLVRNSEVLSRVKKQGNILHTLTL